MNIETETNWKEDVFLNKGDELQIWIIFQTVWISELFRGNIGATFEKVLWMDFFSYSQGGTNWFQIAKSTWNH
jgi:hypothetical protein